MKSQYVYHAVTERPMSVGQVILFDENHHNGVYNRIMSCQKLMNGESADGELDNFISSEMDNWIPCTFQELALEKVRQEEFPQYPSRLSCLYTSKTLDEAMNWAKFFKKIGRTVYSVVKIEVEGNIFAGNACNCFDGTEDESYNLQMARRYWNNEPSEDRPVLELLAAGKLTVKEIYPAP